ncbi:unnamed protein product [Didymodactylos carnosus]|uniref:cysteine--tRNA ligase n=1 Tax=Didymodactylos carnosus TaxID=1234261 RepID=A0A814KTP8_9BILA|nr:unnamed protein product [Didymodactylos carnosus]CAF3824579.1 unnamed protein product [Didymodactylos carnosus]
MSKRTEKLQTKYPGTLFWYTCGPTVYDSSHIGHGSTYVTFDIIYRILKNVFNYKIVLLMGITDIDDKIIKRSKDENVHYLEIAKKYEQEFINDMNTLNVHPPNIYCRVSDHIQTIIDFIKKLVQDGCAYVTSSGSVYFDISLYAQKNETYPLTPLKQSTLVYDILNEKRDQRDFALWKATKDENEPTFKSPWGYGRPGWHIECSAMASRTFGSHLDIHSGGFDLWFPHHANEIAQCNSYHNTKQWGTYWIHAGLLNTRSDEEKMSKSLQNTISIREMLKTYTPQQFRLFCLLQHHRQHRSFNSTSMKEALFFDKLFLSFTDTVNACQKGLLHMVNLSESEIIERVVQTNQDIIDCLANDFSTPDAMGKLRELINWINPKLSSSPKFLDEDSTTSAPPIGALYLALDLVQKWLDIFGVKISSYSANTSNETLLTNVIEEAVQFRKNVRNISRLSTNEDGKKTLLESCDEFRSRMKYLGVEIKKSPTPLSVIHPVFYSPQHQQQSGLTMLTSSTHWKLERVVAVALLAIIPGSFVLDSSLMNYLLAGSLAMHAHWGMDTVLLDYCPRNAMPLANAIRYILTAVAFAGLCYYNYNDMGLTNALKKLWAMH